MDMVIHRLGMSGCLAYEVHGPAADANAVYKIIKQAGQKYGIEPQGFETYCTNHTQGGYPNQYIHYIYPVFPEDDPALAAFIKKPVPKYAGSASDNHDNYYMNPYDVGWGSRINFDHEFPGKKALLEISNGEHKVPVTLEWNAEDAGKIFLPSLWAAMLNHAWILLVTVMLAMVKCRKVHAFIAIMYTAATKKLALAPAESMTTITVA